MNCLLIAATTLEIAPFIEFNKNLKKTGEKVDILITGIGLTATTYALQKQVMAHRPRFVIQAGIAGCFDKKIKTGAVRAIKKEVIADEGVVEKNRLLSPFDLGLAAADQFPFTKGLLVNPHKELISKSKLKTVNAISVNQVSTSKKMMAFYSEKYTPVTESMEGAALHYVCLMENIPFLQIRSISNYTGDRNKKHWNFKDSIANLN